MSLPLQQSIGLQPLSERLRGHQGRHAIPAPYLLVLTALAILPLLLIGLRVLAVTGMAPNAPGSWLEQHLSLLWVDAVDRTAVLHVVQLPLAALLVALTRLTLGIRVLGFRAILIAIGMREVGILPSLVLIAIIAASVVLIRPLMRRSGMPLYARVSTILALVAATMVTGLLLGSAFDSSLLSSFAFFPVVILAMLAESIADTVARESTAMAAWRTGTTIVLALAIAVLCAWPALRELTLACPELILTQLVLVVFVSEFLDYRLLEDFRPGTDPRPASAGMHIAVVRNRWNNSVLRHTGPRAPQRYRLRSVQALVDTLREAGHTVAVLEADARLFSHLRDFFPRHALGDPGRALVINCAGGVQGRGRLAQVPSLCEMIGVPCSGPDALAMAGISDRLLQARSLAAHGIAAPAYRPAEQAAPGGGPWLVAHRFQSDRAPLRARSQAALERAVQRIRASFDEPLVATEPCGRRLRIYVLGDDAAGGPLRILPPLERRGAGGGLRPAVLDAAEQNAAAAAARTAFIALRCRNFARIDAWIDADGEVGVLQLRAIEIPSPRGAAAKAARAAGLAYSDFLVQAVGLGTRSARGEGDSRPALLLTPASSR
jgi:D-alanine-D-alanine ligase